jgi:hypothetical protein
LKTTTGKRISDEGARPNFSSARAAYSRERSTQAECVPDSSALSRE